MWRRYDPRRAGCARLTPPHHQELVAILERYKFMQATARDKAESERKKALMDSAEDARQLAIFNASQVIVRR